MSSDWSENACSIELHLKSGKKWTTHEMQVEVNVEKRALNGSCTVRFLWFIAQFFHRWGCTANTQQVARVEFAQRENLLISTPAFEIDFFLKGCTRSLMFVMCEGGEQFSTFPPRNQMRNKQIYWKQSASLGRGSENSQSAFWNVPDNSIFIL